jgi:hypothetical protein
MASPSSSSLTRARLSRFFRLFAATAIVGTAAALGGAALLGGSVASCLTTESYVYFAQKYDPAGDCLETNAPVEVVNGSGASSVCPAACLTVGADLFVSTVCPPLPAIATAVPADAGDCIKAVAAAKRGGTCDAPAEAGSEPDAESDGDADLDSGGGEPDTGVDAADGSVGITDASDAG